ncbi:hypothetical protein ABZT49_03290 [Methylobacterium sp. EM32]|uniref:hypothetical protein n=1 Tax=Methylobacterium sp. EM32 TaxID=3163481 RepID=UPI0033A08221
MPWLAWLAKDSDTIANDYWGANACEFASSSGSNANINAENRRRRRSSYPEVTSHRAAVQVH